MSDVLFAGSEDGEAESPCFDNMEKTTCKTASRCEARFLSDEVRVSVRPATRPEDGWKQATLVQCESTKGICGFSA